MKPRIQSLANLFLMLALAAVCTYWVLHLAAVRRPLEPVISAATADPVPQTQPIDTGATAALFGISTSAAPTRVEVTGIIAEGGSSAGVALLSVDGQPAMAYRAGETIDAETLLVEVQTQGVVLLRPQGTLDVRMPKRAAPEGIVPAQ